MKSVTRVIKKMGEKWVCHKANHVQRLATPLTDSAGTNVAETFKRVMAERERQPNNVRRILVAK